jgi:two-component system, OmpR family, response regulator BaeR
MTITPRTVLVVEDDSKISQLLLDYLRDAGFAATAIADGRLALAHIKANPPAAIVLDVMLPSMDGITVCRAVRKYSDVPILMLTARIDEADRLIGLETGADDYVCKPFSPREVVARIRALVRRADGTLRTTSTVWTIDEPGLRIAWRNEWLTLTTVEYRLLRALLLAHGRVFSRAQLLASCGGSMRDASDRTIDSHIKNIRRKLEAVEPGCPCVVAVYGAGYRFDRPTTDMTE